MLSTFCSNNVRRGKLSYTLRSFLLKVATHLSASSSGDCAAVNSMLKNNEKKSNPVSSFTSELVVFENEIKDLSLNKA